MILKASTLSNSDIHFSGLTDEGLECSGADGGLDDVSHLETGLCAKVGNVSDGSKVEGGK